MKFNLKNAIKGLFIGFICSIALFLVMGLLIGFLLWELERLLDLIIEVINLEHPILLRFSLFLGIIGFILGGFLSDE